MLSDHQEIKKMEYKFLKIQRHDHVAVVMLNRPEKLNTLCNDLINEITNASRDFQNDTNIRVVIYTGAGSCFSAGIDLVTLKETINNMDNTSTLKMLRNLRKGPEMIRAIYEMDQITIAAINGDAIGGGACITAACDFRIGTENCRVGFPEVRLGMNLSWLALPLCVNLIGPARAKQMIILAEMLDSETLLDWGYLDWVVSNEELLLSARQTAEKFASKPPMAAQMVKRSVNAIAAIGDLSVMHMDSDQCLLTFKTDEFVDGLKTFIEKRKK
jgi:enoyl-CoA hydratase